MNTSKQSLVLVVDDTKTNRLLLSRALEKKGYEVITANDGFEAVDAAKRHQPDLILLDMMMPRRDGLETCTILQNDCETSSIPVIFVTAITDADQVVKAFAAGGCDYVTKPFRADELLARVSTHVRLRQAEKELRRNNDQMQALTYQLTETNVELAALSRIDSMTNLLNRRTWEEIVRQEHDRFLRHKHAYSIVMVDADFFKAYNDSCGHQAGDECLRKIAESIMTVCRSVDSVGRYGGEEFVILAPETQSNAAVKLAERVRKAVWGLALPHPASRNAERVTISLGVAGSDGDSWEQVLKAADDALYVAKKAGRNMVFAGCRPSTPNPKISSSDITGDSEAATKTVEQSQVNVLVVDDEPTNRILCRRCLEDSGYGVREAEDGVTGLKSVREDPPDVIIMDVMMPRMDGLECTRQLKADADTRDIPVIMISARSESSDILAGLEAGADEYLTKPIRTTELTLRVRSMARLYREHADLLRSYEVRGEHTRVLTSLVEFCRSVGSSRSVDDVLRCTIDTVADVTYSRRISIMFPDKKENRLRIARSRGIDEELASTIVVPIGDPIAGQVFASRKRIVMNSEVERKAVPTVYDSLFFASVPLISTPLNTVGGIIGVLNVTGRADKLPFDPHELEYLELIANVAATAVHDIQTRDDHDRASDSIMLALAKLAEHRDNDTGRHLDRVTKYCCILAEDLRNSKTFSRQIDDEFTHDLVRAVPLHDIGKVAIPDHILLYPGGLSPDQMEIMRTHAAIGAKTILTLVERSPGVTFLQMAADIANYHHEWHDGSGYPTGLKGNDIPVAARITALADVYDALTTKRVYKNAIAHDKAVDIIVEGSGTQFDPTIVDAFLRHQKSFTKLAKTMADELPDEVAPLTAPQPATI